MVPITLIVAPAGFGKSTVARQWVEHHPEFGCGWYQIRPEHNTLDRFLEQLWLAIDSATGQPEPTPNDLSVGLIHDRLSSSNQLVLVIDDYHLVENMAIHHTVQQLLHTMPANCSVLLISRTLPNLSLARLHAHGCVRNITQEDLAFTVDEIQQLFAHHTLSSELIDRLAERTEGWIAALRLASMAIELDHRQTPGHIERVIDALAANRLLSDFIAEEMLDSLSDDLRRFVLDTSVLTRLEPELCNAVLQIETSASLIAQLENQVVFVERPGGSATALSYHQLFAECVQRLRRDSDGPTAAELRLRASRWYLDRGELETAANYALAAEAWDEAARIIGEFVPLDFAHINVWDSFYWVGRLPESALHRDTRLLQSYISTILGNGRINEARPLVEAFLQTPGFEPTPRQAGWLANQRAYIAFVDGDRGEALYQSYRALALLPWEDASGRLLSWSGVYRELCARGERDLAQAALQEAVADHKRQARESIYWHFLMAPDISNDVAIRGDLFGAEALNLHFIKNLPPHLQASPGAFKLRLLCIYLEQNRLDLAAAEVEDILADLNERKYLIWSSGALVAVANYALATGDPEYARHTLERSVETTRQFGGNELIRKAETGLAHYWLQTGQDRLAQFWADSTPLPPHVIRAFGDVDPRSLRIQLLFRQNRHDEAMDLAKRSIALAQACGNVFAEIALTVWATAVALTQGHSEQASAMLRHALELGTPGRFVRIYASTDVDLRDSIRTLLPTLTGDVRLHAASLLGETACGQQATGNTIWIDVGLTVREREVLKELMLGKSNRDIAKSLFITERTVKKHLANVFTKTGTSNRSAAAVWGREHIGG